MEQTVRAIYDLSSSVQVMGNHVQALTEEMKVQGQRLTDLERLPGDRWEQAVKTAVTAVVSAGVGAVLAQIIQ